MKRHRQVFKGLLVTLFLAPAAIFAQDLTNVPSLDELAGDWLPMAAVANPPDVNNFHEMLLVNRDLTSFFCYPEGWLWNGGPRFGYPPITLTVGGREYPADECRWYPYRALRRNLNCDGLSVETDTRMINEQRVVLLRIQVANLQATAKTAQLVISVPGTLQPDGISVGNLEQRPGVVTIIRPAEKPDAVTNDNGVVRWKWNVTLPTGSQRAIELVAGDGPAPAETKVTADVTRWSTDFQNQFDGFKQCWEQRWTDAFTPGNGHFSGHLPVLVTADSALRRNYYMGIVTLLELERTQFPVSPRSFITSGERAPGTQYYWDASMQTTVWAMLEPAGMKATLRRWLVQNVRSGSFTYLKDTNGFDTNHYDRITGYAFNACTIFKTTFDYLRITGDLAFLDERLADGKTVLERMDEIATDWTTLVLPGSSLASYGDNANLLECAPAYVNRVASANAQDVWMMRQCAALEDLKGHLARARELREDAQKLLPEVMSLYKPGDGVWYGLHTDGQRVELRHCVDFIYVGDALPVDLTPTMRREMTGFVTQELLTRDWMRAMSLKDAAAALSDRPDHGPMGAYDGWIPLTVGTMWRLGFPEQAFAFYDRCAAVTQEGPFAQAREFYGPNRGQPDAPVRIAARDGCMKECISGVAFADVVINTFFGFDPALDGKTIFPDAGQARPFGGELLHVPLRDGMGTVVADQHGVRLTKE